MPLNPVPLNPVPLNNIEVELSGGHPNSLGNTIAIVERILDDPALLDNLIDCYGSDDAVVRLRVSSALKRISGAHPQWLMPYLDRMLTTIASIDQASTQWTLAIVFDRLRGFMSAAESDAALTVMKRNLDTSDDWIVQNTTMQVLAEWARSDVSLGNWLAPRLLRLAASPRKSVAGRARKLLDHPAP